MAYAQRTGHWLAQVARKAGLGGAEALEIPADLELEEAWKDVADATGLTLTELATQVAASFRLEVAALDTAEARTRKLVPEAMAHRYQVFPLRETYNTLVVATADPTELETERELGFAAGRRVVFEVAPPDALRDALETDYSRELLDFLVDNVDPEVAEAVQVVAAERPERVLAPEARLTPVIQLTNAILRTAVQERATDIHIEPGPNGATVRYRVDGVLRHHMRMPMVAANRVVSRIKILGDLDITDRLRPQDGHVRVEVDGKGYDLRISTVPTLKSEKAVIRILDPESARGLDDLGISTPELTRIRQLLSFREGIVMLTGPTGSGKTTTAQGALSDLAKGDVNITTVEDPVEYRLPGITQIQIEPAQNLTFASALRAVLRQDPDIIFVGEIRDSETAEIAAQASMTGHLVLATVHSNDAVGVVARLTDLGLDPATIAGSLRGCIGQRLVRRLCEECKVSVDAEGGGGPARAKGCRHCDRTGYRGRAPLNEVLVSTPEVAACIAGKATAAELQDAAVAGGMRPFEEVGRECVQEGLTDESELARVLGEGVPRTAADESSTPHVLVIDDDPEDRQLAKTILEGADFKVSVAVDGPTGLEQLRSGEDFSLVLLDLDMPELDGREVLTKVRGDVTTAGLPVVMLTGTTQVEAEMELMDKGADDYLRKPVNPRLLISRVKAALRRAGS